MDLAKTSPTTQGVPPASTVVYVPVTVASTASGGLPTSVEVADMISATMPAKTKQKGTHRVYQAPAPPLLRRQ
jgi:hypothetical protein